jgi:hypothetical protein
MANIDEAEVKRVAAAIYDGRLGDDRAAAGSKKLHRNRQAVGKLLKSYFRKSELEKLSRLAGKRRSEILRIFEERNAAAGKRQQSLEPLFREGITSRRNALGLLKGPHAPFFINLDAPFLIWEFPHPELDIFLDQHVESMNSWIKVLVQRDAGSDNTAFTFFFLWTNDSEFAAVVNVGTSVVLNGVCEVVASEGIFSGDYDDLSLTASLTLIRWSGWGTDPFTGQSNDQTPEPFVQTTQFQTASSLVAQGGSIFGTTFPGEIQVFPFQPFDLSYSLFAIPAGATTLFEVSVEMSYGVDIRNDGTDGSDYILFDFASDNFAREIICPGVTLEVLTAPQAARAL